MRVESTSAKVPTACDSFMNEVEIIPHSVVCPADPCPAGGVVCCYCSTGPPMTALSDVELTAVRLAACSLQPVDRDAFLATVATELAAVPAAAIGPGSVHRTIVNALQRILGAPPERRGGGPRHWFDGPNPGTSTWR